MTSGISGPRETWVHPITLYIPGGATTIHAAFMENLPIGGLLGMNGFFEHFVVTFIHSARLCEIERIQTGMA